MSRRKFFELADLRKAPLPIEAVRRIDQIFAIEREINGAAPDRRCAVRKAGIKPRVDELRHWMEAERTRLSRHAATAKAIDYMLKRWPAFTRFLDDGRINDHSAVRLADLLPWNWEDRPAKLTA